MENCLKWSPLNRDPFNAMTKLETIFDELMTFSGLASCDIDTHSLPERRQTRRDTTLISTVSSPKLLRNFYWFFTFFLSARHGRRCILGVSIIIHHLYAVICVIVLCFEGWLRVFEGEKEIRKQNRLFESAILSERACEWKVEMWRKHWNEWPHTTDLATAEIRWTWLSVKGFVKRSEETLKIN